MAYKRPAASTSSGAVKRPRLGGLASSAASKEEPSPTRTAALLSSSLRAAASPSRARVSARFFKIGPGEYGEGDEFIGVTLPDIRELARRHPLTPSLESLSVPRTLLRSRIHEERLLGVILLDNAAKALLKRPDGENQRFRAIFEVFAEALDEANVAGRGGANNWTLVDSAAPRMVGGYIDHCKLDTQRKKAAFLCRMATSSSRTLGVADVGSPTLRPETTSGGKLALLGHPHLWRRRAAVVASLHFASRGDAATPTPIAVAEAVLKSQESRPSSGAGREPGPVATHDLIQKASGWALREAGKADEAALETFLDRHAATMPRTMLRYAIERLSTAKRRRCMAT